MRRRSAKGHACHLEPSQYAARSARRNPSRTILSIGLAAVASFLIVALSAFRLSPSESGTGGYELLATADQPIHFDLNTAEGRDRLGFGDADNRQLADVQVESLRVHAGEDASCLNLYQTAQPQVLGVPTTMHANNRFAWVATNEPSQPWLSNVLTVNGLVPFLTVMILMTMVQV